MFSYILVKFSCLITSNYWTLISSLWMTWYLLHFFFCLSLHCPEIRILGYTQRMTGMSNHMLGTRRQFHDFLRWLLSVCQFHGTHMLVNYSYLYNVPIYNTCISDNTPYLLSFCSNWMAFGHTRSNRAKIP